MKSNKHIAIIALLNLKGIGPAFVKKTLESTDYQFSDVISELKEILSSNKKSFDDDTLFYAVDSAKETMFDCQEESIQILDFTNPNYPKYLLQLKDAPPIIFIKGNSDLLYKKTVCIIGTRAPIGNGSRIAELVGQHFSNHNWAICNGLAAGIDRASISSNDQLIPSIVGVLAGGLNYNSKKTLLKETAIWAERTLENGGVLVSEIIPGIKEDTFTVVKSCRIQAGLSLGLVLIQSSLSGGSKYTTKAFCETIRPIAVIKPTPSEMDLEAYTANKEIAFTGKVGLSTFTELKTDKIQTKDLLLIQSKSDYDTFEQKMLEQVKEQKPSNQSLFD